jgi:hypothetical protein
VGHPKAKVVRSSHFPFLDMQMTWLDEGDLQFRVYLKLGQELKYLTSDSSHPIIAFKAITKGVFGWLASLTSLTNKFRYKSIKDLYPQHHRSLKLAGLAPKYIPMLQEVLNLNNGKEKCKEEKLEQDKQRNRSLLATQCSGRNQSTCGSKNWGTDSTSSGCESPCCTTNFPTWGRCLQESSQRS